MSEAQTQAVESGQTRITDRITELRVSGHLMTLDTGTFCVFHAPGSAAGIDHALGLPGVRISLPPGPMHNPDEVSISTFRPDGWLGGSDAAALIRVASGPAQVLVTIYQAPGQGAESAPRLQVLRLNPEPADAAEAAATSAQASDHAAQAGKPSGKPEVLAHVQATGDVPGRLGEWVGLRGSRNWIEGFSVLPPAPLTPEDIEYQAVLGRGWLSPWVNGGQFCGSRGMALPLLGLRVRLKGDAAANYDFVCHASFVDGTEIGPLPAGAECEAESLAPLEAFQITLVRAAGAKEAGAKEVGAKEAAPAAKSAKKSTAPASPAKRPATAKPIAPATSGATGKSGAIAKPTKPTTRAKPAAKAKPLSGAMRSRPPGRPAR